MWDNNDAANLRSFLFSPSGKRFMEEMNDIKPRATVDTDMEMSAFIAHRIAHHEDITERVEYLRDFHEEPDKNTVPFIDPRR